MGKHNSSGVSSSEDSAHKGLVLSAVSMQTPFPTACSLHPGGSAYPTISISMPGGMRACLGVHTRWLPPFYCLTVSGCLGAARPHCIGMSRGSKSRIPLNFSDEKGLYGECIQRCAWVPPRLEEGELPPAALLCSIQGTSALCAGGCAGPSPSGRGTYWCCCLLSLCFLLARALLVVLLLFVGDFSSALEYH